MALKVSKTLAWYGFVGLAYVVFVTPANSCTPSPRPTHLAKGSPEDTFGETCFPVSLDRFFALTFMFFLEKQRQA